MDNSKSSDSTAAPPGRDLILDLNFVPGWARSPAGANPYTDHAGERRVERPRREKRGPDQRGPDQRGRGQMRGSHRDSDRRPQQIRDRGERRPRSEPVSSKRLPVEIQFLPDRDKLGHLVREVRRGGRAYPMMNLASLFIHSPDHYLIKLMVRAVEGASSPALFQCKRCRTVSMDRKQLEDHILSAHLEDVYESETLDAGPPAGNFVCVCRCRLSGTLLGPPNYHGYKQKVQELHASRFSGMKMDEYQRSIETIHDPELVEKWKTENRMRHVYRVRAESGNHEGAVEAAPEMNAAEACAHFREHHLQRLVHEGSRAILPATVAQQMDDRDLKAMIREAWTRESRFPLSLSFAMRPAFRHMRLHLFKTDRKHVFVTPILPRPLDPGITIDSIRDELTFLQEHPGCTRQKLVDSLRPDAAVDSPKVAEVVSNLQWLIEKGHVIEFHDGTLAVPAATRPGPQGAVRDGAHTKPKRAH